MLNVLSHLRMQIVFKLTSYTIPEEVITFCILYM